MKSSIFNLLTFFVASLLILSTTNNGIAQEQNNFWKKTQFGTGLGLNLNSSYFNTCVSPSIIYNFDKTYSAGLGLQGSYANQKNVYSSFIYGGSVILLVNPIREIQLSAELEELHIKINYENKPGFKIPTKEFWTTALFLGAGFRTQNITAGLKYNILHNSNKNVYSSAFMPFIRVYF